MRNRRQSPTINAGSMADIAFLLLIFWLVATTLKPETGWKGEIVSDEEDPKIAVVTSQNDLYRVYVKTDGLELNGEDTDLTKLESYLEKAANRLGVKVIISADFDSSYKDYTQVIELAKKFNLKIIYNEI